jgi:hypothetical protein
VPPIGWRRTTTSAPLQRLLGLRDVSTTMIYTHMLNRGAAGVQRPPDRMFLCSDIRYPNGIPGSASRPITERGAGAFARWREFRHSLGASGRLPVIDRPTQPCNAVQATSR